MTRKLLPILALLLCCAATANAACSNTALGNGATCIEIVAGQNSGSQCDATGSCTVPITSTSAGDTSIVSIGFAGSSLPTISSVTDNAPGGSDTCTASVSDAAFISTWSAYTYLCPNMKAGTTSLTVTD